MSQINPYIESYEPKDYSGVDVSACELDCSLGVSYFPLPEDIFTRLGEIPESEVKHYPHNSELLQDIVTKLCARYKIVAPHLKSENVYWGCGSHDLLCKINLLYANANKVIMGHIPQFTAYIDNANCIGAKYIAYPLDKNNNYKFDTHAFCSMVLANEPNLICCENPNNPTGQTISPETMREIINAAKEVNAAVIFDEAYGDYVTDSLSAVPYVTYGEDQGVDVYVTRTFSKGYGAAGIRMGYVFGPAHGITQLKKVLIPFNSNELARQCAQVLLNLPYDYFINLREKTRQSNEYLYERIRAMGKYKIAETDMGTPICTLYVEDESVDLFQVLYDVGLGTVSGKYFDNLGQHAVRMMLCNNVERMAELLELAKV